MKFRICQKNFYKDYRSELTWINKGGGVLVILLKVKKKKKVIFKAFPTKIIHYSVDPTLEKDNT